MVRDVHAQYPIIILITKQHAGVQERLRKRSAAGVAVHAERTGRGAVVVAGSSSRLEIFERPTRDLVLQHDQ
jgi:hypothetical protein